VTPDPDERRRYEAAEIAVYQQLDRAVGHILAAVDAPALTVLVSDHGATPAGPAVPLRRILADAGLLSAEDRGGRDLGEIEWGRTLAAPHCSCYVRVNVVGRERQGVVMPDDFERVRQRAIDVMLSYRDAATGRSPFSMVIPKEDAVSLGLYGDGVGDIVYAVCEEFADEHGRILPQATRAAGSWGMRALCLYSGDGVGSGQVVDDPGTLTDVAPAICDALGIPRPLQSEGLPPSRVFTG
jgi:predicted AlkP superfamily phosphohydrolase/phosphomutase